jgi:hypothetical protein
MRARNSVLSQLPQLVQHICLDETHEGAGQVGQDLGDAVREPGAVEAVRNAIIGLHPERLVGPLPLWNISNDAMKPAVSF